MGIDIRKFFFIAAILMIIVILGNLYSTYVTWGFTNLGAKVSNIANLCFTALLAFFFWNSYQTAPVMPPIGTPSLPLETDEQFEELLKEINAEEIEPAPIKKTRRKK